MAMYYRHAHIYTIYSSPSVFSDKDYRKEAAVSMAHSRLGDVLQNQFIPLQILLLHFLLQLFKAIPPPPIDFFKLPTCPGLTHFTVPRFIVQDIMNTFNLLVSPQWLVDRAQRLERVVDVGQWLPFAAEVGREEVLVRKGEGGHERGSGQVFEYRVSELGGGT
jgi:hypothetical protein